MSELAGFDVKRTSVEGPTAEAGKHALGLG